MDEELSRSVVKAQHAVAEAAWDVMRCKQALKAAEVGLLSLPMEWHFINAMTFECATHRVRHIGTYSTSYWIAERKAIGHEHGQRVGLNFENQAAAQDACERDAYAVASGR